MDTLFMDSKNSGTSDPHRLLIYLTNKMNLKRSDRYVALSNLSIYYTWKSIRKSYENNNLKIPARMKNFNYLMDHILYQIFKIIFNIS